MFSLKEILSQSQTENNASEIIPSSQSSNLDNPSAIGRESIQSSTDNNLDFEDPYDIEHNIDFLKRKALNSDDEKTVDEINKLDNKENPRKNDLTSNKPNEEMLWHYGLKHASLKYLKKLKQKEPQLKEAKFVYSIKDCEVCVIAKMKNLQF